MIYCPATLSLHVPPHCPTMSLHIVPPRFWWDNLVGQFGGTIPTSTSKFDDFMSHHVAQIVPPCSPKEARAFMLFRGGTINHRISMISRPMRRVLDRIKSWWDNTEGQFGLHGGTLNHRISMYSSALSRQIVYQIVPPKIVAGHDGLHGGTIWATWRDMMGYTMGYTKKYSPPAPSSEAKHRFFV